MSVSDTVLDVSRLRMRYISSLRQAAQSTSGEEGKIRLLKGIHEAVWEAVIQLAAIRTELENQHE
jgi:hypothetical protein